MLSYKIMKLDEFDDAVFYRVACGCSSKDHDFELWLEYDRKINDITMMISKKLYWKHHYENWPWYERVWKRLVAGLKLIFGGFLEMEADVLFMEKKHIKGFIEAMNEGLTKMKNISK